MEKYKGALLHSSEFIWAMLVIHCNVEPAPGHALNSHDHHPRTKQWMNARDHIPHDKVPDQQVTTDTMKNMIPETVDASYY